MSEQDNIDKYIQYANVAHERRGNILSQCISLERLIDELLAKYFCQDDDKRRELLGLVLYNGKLGFKAKVITTKAVFKDKFPELKEDFDATMSTLFSILEKRNTLAHRSVNYTNFKEELLLKRHLLRSFTAAVVLKLENENMYKY